MVALRGRPSRRRPGSSELLDVAVDQHAELVVVPLMGGRTAPSAARGEVGGLDVSPTRCRPRSAKLHPTDSWTRVRVQYRAPAAGRGTAPRAPAPRCRWAATPGPLPREHVRGLAHREQSHDGVLGGHRVVESSGLHRSVGEHHRWPQECSGRPTSAGRPRFLLDRSQPRGGSCPRGPWLDQRPLDALIEPRTANSISKDDACASFWPLRPRSSCWEEFPAARSREPLNHTRRKGRPQDDRARPSELRHLSRRLVRRPPLSF